MAFDKTMVLTCLAVALVIVTGAVIAVNGDLSSDSGDDATSTSDNLRTDIKIGDYYVYNEYISMFVDEPVLMKYQIVDYDEENEVYIMETFTDGVSDGTEEVTAEEFIDGMRDVGEISEGTEPVIKDYPTKFGNVKCYVYEESEVVEEEGSVMESSMIAVIGVESGVTYLVDGNYSVDGEPFLVVTMELIETSLFS